MWAENSADIGNCAPGNDDQSGVMYLDTPVIGIPRTADTYKIQISHIVASEKNYDGGNVRIQINGDGLWIPVQKEFFIYNPYNTVLTKGPNPMSHVAAWSGVNVFEDLSQ